MTLREIIQRWLGWVVIGLAIIGLIYWGQQYTQKPPSVKIATAGKGGYYYNFGLKLEEHIEKDTGLIVDLLNTKGAVDNAKWLRSRRADLAIIETGTLESMSSINAVAPLWNEYAQVVVKRGLKVDDLRKLADRRVSIGRVGSGDRANVGKILEHYDINPNDIQNNNLSARKLLELGPLDAAVLTTSPMHPMLREIMATGDFELLPIKAAPGLDFKYPYFTRTQIPSGVYTTVRGPKPDEPVETVTTMAILAAHKDAPYDLIKKIMPVIYSIDFQAAVPGLLGKDDLKNRPDWKLLPQHPASQSYYNPYKGAELASNMLETLNQLKWAILLIVIIAVVGWNKWKDRDQLQERIEFSRDTKQMQFWLSQLGDLERKQRDAKDLRVIKEYHAQAVQLRQQVVDAKLGDRARNSNLYMTVVLATGHLIDELTTRLSNAGPVKTSI